MGIFQEFKKIVERTMPTVPSTIFRCKIYPGGCQVALMRGKRILIERKVYRNEIEGAFNSDALATTICSVLCLIFKGMNSYS